MPLLTAAWKDYLFEHHEVFIAELAGLILNVDVLVHVHEAEPLLHGVDRDAKL